MTAAGTRAIDLGRRSGVEHQVHAYEPSARHGRDRDARPSYGREAAAALGIDPGRLFKTLVASVDERLVLAVIPVDRELDPKALADAVEGRRAELADPAVAERATGYVVGGISPIGTRRALPVVLDASATARPTVFVSAGRRGLQLELAPADLARLTGAIVASVARDH
ncbi:MAG: aminoacyl-tRNA deacylase [Chloroflexi bacterium]|nr:aminoacyl-tRNA deacylase [Chloroflexota bacterium]